MSLPAARIVGDSGYVLGVDPSAAMRDIASSHGTFDTVAGVAEDLPITGETFDMVTMGYALRHVDDMDVAFSEFLRVLSPGGTVTILEITRPRSTLGRLATRIVMNSIAPALSVVASRNADGWRLMRYFWKTIDGGFFLTVPADKTVRLRCGGPTTGSEGAGGRHEADSRAPGAGMGAPVLPGAVASFTVKLPPLSGKLPHSENRKRQSS